MAKKEYSVAAKLELSIWVPDRCPDPQFYIEDILNKIEDILCGNDCLITLEFKAEVLESFRDKVYQKGIV